jgi:nucleoside-diphosphate-sugar epimerase
MTEKVLVTGGAGFIGSHLCERLLMRGYRVRVLDNLSFGKKEWVPSEVEFLEGDIRNIDDCHRACKNIAGVFHAAAMSRAGPSIEAIDICTQQNIFGTQNILIAARDSKVKKFVYSGSSTYYGNQSSPHTEEMASDFLNFYALSKAAGEQYCLMFHRLFGLPVTILRYFNVYGPRQPETGAYALVLGIFLRKYFDGKTLEIHGDGKQRRDFIHVQDVADANIAAFKLKRHGQTYNVGSGSNIAINELADMISPNQVHVPRRAGDAEVTLADISRIVSETGWQPQVTFEDGLKDLIQYMKRR